MGVLEKGGTLLGTQKRMSRLEVLGRAVGSRRGGYVANLQICTNSGWISPTFEVEVKKPLMENCSDGLSDMEKLEDLDTPYRDLNECEGGWLLWMELSWVWTWHCHKGLMGGGWGSPWGFMDLETKVVKLCFVCLLVPLYEHWERRDDPGSVWWWWWSENRQSKLEILPHVEAQHC